MAACVKRCKTVVETIYVVDELVTRHGLHKLVVFTLISHVCIMSKLTATNCPHGTLRNPLDFIAG